MAILATARVQGLDQATYEGMVGQLSDQLKSSPGFVVHAGGPGGDGWQIVEIWESEEEYRRWYEGTVQPNLLPGIEPQISTQELHTVVRA